MSVEKSSQGLFLLTSTLFILLSPNLLTIGATSGEDSHDEEQTFAENADMSNKKDNDDESIWNTTFGFLMYFLMVLFFALQITLLIFCLGIFIKKMCCESYSEPEPAESASIGAVNFGHTPESDNNDEKKDKILKQLKDPNNKDFIIFSLPPDSPLVNNWVGDGIASQSHLSMDSADSQLRPESRLSVKTMDSSVSVSVVSQNSRWACPICLNVKESNTICLPCKHAYHKVCLKDYVVYSLEHNLAFKCPICRCQLQINMDYKR